MSQVACAAVEEPGPHSSVDSSMDVVVAYQVRPAQDARLRGKANPYPWPAVQDQPRSEPTKEEFEKLKITLKDNLSQITQMRNNEMAQYQEIRDFNLQCEEYRERLEAAIDDEEAKNRRLKLAELQSSHINAR